MAGPIEQSVKEMFLKENVAGLFTGYARDMGAKLDLIVEERIEKINKRETDLLRREEKAALENDKLQSENEKLKRCKETIKANVEELEKKQKAMELAEMQFKKKETELQNVTELQAKQKTILDEQLKKANSDLQALSLKHQELKTREAKVVETEIRNRVEKTDLDAANAELIKKEEQLAYQRNELSVKNEELERKQKELIQKQNELSDRDANLKFLECEMEIFQSQSRQKSNDWMPVEKFIEGVSGEMDAHLLDRFKRVIEFLKRNGQVFIKVIDKLDMSVGVQLPTGTTEIITNCTGLDTTSSCVQKLTQDLIRMVRLNHPFTGERGSVSSLQP